MPSSLCKQLIILVAIAAAAGSARAANSVVTIGALAYRGNEQALQRWSPTARYLSTQIPEHRFVVRPYTLDAMRTAMEQGEIDFVLTNPGHYVELEAAYGLTRLVTLTNLRGGKPYTVFGAVIFTRADRPDINRLQDLRGRTFMAVSPDAFGGFQMAWHELVAADIDPFTDFSRLEFNGFPQDAIVYAVRDGIVDAGTVRTDILERMAAEGYIDLEDYRVLNLRMTPGFPFRHTTRLYPEWPFAKANHTDDAIAQRVAIALLTMPSDHPAAKMGSYAGWTVPLDYNTVHELFRELGIGPYREELMLSDFMAVYRYWILGSAALILLMATTTGYVLHLNRKLKRSALVLENQVRERHRTQAELRKLSSAVEQTADIVLISNRNGVIEYVNPAFEHVTGYGRDEVFGRKPSVVKSGVHDPDFYQRLWETILAGKVFHELFINRRKDGSLYYEEKTITPLKDRRGEIKYFVSTGKDVTQRKVAEEQARAHQAELAHVARVSTMGEMASGIAHELNQPLSAIANYAQGCIRRLNAQGCNVEELIGGLQQITEQSSRAGEIIRRLRNFVRKGESRHARADINDIVREAANFARLEARSKGVQIRIQLGEDLPAVDVDVIQIEQVILNLLRNSIEAMDAMSNGGERRLVIHTWSKMPGSVDVAVWDTGPGFAAEDQEHVFDAFFTTKAQGMGMGLSISRSIVEAHGGRLSAATNSLGGAVFHFSVPATSGEFEYEQQAHHLRG